MGPHDNSMRAAVFEEEDCSIAIQVLFDALSDIPPCEDLRG